MSEQLMRDFAALERRVNRACDLLLQASADATALIGQRAALMLALRQLRNEVQGILGIADAEIREAVGHTNVAVLYLRVQEADAVLAAVEAIVIRPPGGGA